MLVSEGPAVRSSAVVSRGTRSQRGAAGREQNTDDNEGK